MSLARPADPTQAAFAELLRAPEDRLLLDRAAALVARGIAYPDLDVGAVLGRLDALAAALRDRLPAERVPRATIAAINAYLFGELGFRGNVGDYYDPRNSFLNDILARRTGLPIGLSLLYLEVARRLDFPMAGVGLPGHFVVKHSGSEPAGGDIFVDPFFGGAVLTPAQLAERVRASFNGVLSFEEHYLGAVTKKQILTRLLTNLKGYYARRGDARRALAVVEYLLLLAPWNLDERRDRGLLALQLGRHQQALADLEAYEQFAAGASDLDDVRSYLAALRRRFSLPG